MHSSRLSSVGECDPAADDTYTTVTHATLWSDNITHGRSRQASPEQACLHVLSSPSSFWHCLCRDWKKRCYHFKHLSGMRTKGKMKFLPYKWGCDDSGTKWSWWCFLVSLHTVTVNFMKLKSLVRQIFPCGSVGAIPWCSKTHEMAHISSRMPFLIFPLVQLWTGPLETVWAKFGGKFSPWDLFSKVKYQGTEWWTPKVWTTWD